MSLFWSLEKNVAWFREKKFAFMFFPCVLFSALSSRRRQRHNVARSITKIKEGGGLKTEKKPKKKTKEVFEAEFRRIKPEKIIV